MRYFAILIESTHPDAETLARQAGEKIACQIGWGDDQNARITVVATGRELDVSDADHLAAWYMEPGAGYDDPAVRYCGRCRNPFWPGDRSYDDVAAGDPCFACEEE